MTYTITTEPKHGYWEILLNGQAVACTLDGSYQSADSLAYRVEQEAMGRTFVPQDMAQLLQRRKGNRYA